MKHAVLRQRLCSMWSLHSGLLPPALKLYSPYTEIYPVSHRWCGSKTNKRTFRSCHLDVNKPLPIYYADELPDLQDYAGRAVPQMPSGMEKDEEAEHHLQRAMVTGHVIPTPEVYGIDAAIYDMLYPSCFTLPRRLIHMQPFALEQDIPEYDIDSEDEEWLKSQSKSIDLPNSKFEEMVDRLERNSDHTVVSEQDAKSLLRDYDESLIIAVYDYWLNKRFKTKHNLQPLVKTEVRGNTAVNDPYLAFRRRKDKMQTRKNRKNDESSYEKMIKLNWDLNSAQDMLEMIKKREILKRDLVQVHIDIFKKRFELQDWTGHQYQEAILMSKAMRNTPLSNSKFNNTWSNTPNKKVNYVFEDEIIPKKEKRHYKKRKLKNNVAPTSEVTPNFRLSSDDEQSSPQLNHVEDNYFTFRRAAGVSYHAPKSGLGSWPWASTEDGGAADVRHRFNPVYIRSPKPRCIGLARRRIGRGGRVILDRIGPTMDDLWKDLDVKVIERERYFRPKTPPNSFSDESEVECDSKTDASKPYLEIEEAGSSSSTQIEFNFHKPFQIEEDTTTNILERISEDTGHGSILDPFYKTLIRKKLDLMKAGSSLIERWSKLSTSCNFKDEVSYSYEDTLGSTHLSIINSRKSFLDTAASERINNKRKYDQLASSSEQSDEPECPKCKCRKFYHEDVLANIEERNASLRRNHPSDTNAILKKLVYYLNERISINEQIKSELISQLQARVDEFNRMNPPEASSCNCVDSIPPTLPLSSTCFRCGRLKTKSSAPPPPLDKSTSSSPNSSTGSASSAWPITRLRDSFSNSICICDIPFSLPSMPPTVIKLLQENKCLLTNQQDSTLPLPSSPSGNNSSTAMEEYVLATTGVVVQRELKHSIGLSAGAGSSNR